MFSRFFGGESPADEVSESYSSDDEISQSDSSESNESEAEPRSMADYYNDLAAVIAYVRQEIQDADADPGFQRAASKFTKMIKLCRNIEDVISPATFWSINSKRSKLAKEIGEGGMIEITGEASKLLAVHYRDLMIDMVNEKYWPQPTNWLASALVNATYASQLESRENQALERIDEYQRRIDAFDAAKSRQGSHRMS